MFNDLIFASTAFEANDEDDLITLVRDMSWNDQFKKLGVKSVRATISTPDGPRVLQERIEKALPRGWFCKNLKATTEGCYEVTLEHQDKSPVGYLF